MLQLPNKKLRFAFVPCCPNLPNEMLWLLTAYGIEKLKCEGGWRTISRP